MVRQPALLRGFCLFSSCLAGLLWSGQARPQSKSDAKANSALQYRSTVTLKLIQVTVTDGRGNPITDLEKNDFVVWDDGEEKRITEFEKHALPLPAPDAATPKVDQTAPVQLASSAPLLGRKFILVFDSVFVHDNGYRRAREACLSFIKGGLRPEDQVAVLSFTGARNLRVDRLLTRDHAAALAVVTSLNPGNLMNGIAPQDLGDSDDYGLAITRSADDKGRSHALAASPIAADARLVAGNFIWSLRSFAQAVRYVPGKKHLILCSNGISGKTIGRGEYAYGRNTDLSRDYDDACRELAASNVSIYPINTADTVIGFTEIDKADWKESKTGAPFLRDMATSTGGRFLGSARNAPEIMERVQSLTGAYYVIGYPVSESWDGKYHTIRVKVRRPGAEVQAQPGYFDPKPFSEYSETERTIDLIDLALAEKPLSQEPVRFSMRTAFEAGTPAGDIHVLAEISSAGLGDVAGPRVEFASLLIDGLDQIVGLARTELDLTPSAVGGDRTFLFATLAAPPGGSRCRLVLRNLESGRAAVAGADVGVPHPDAGKLVIFPPLFVIPGGRARYLGAAVGRGPNGTPLGVADQVARAFLFDPVEFSPLRDGPVKGGAPLFAVVEAAVPGAVASKITLDASLTDESNGTVTALPLAILAEKGRQGGHTFFVKLEIPELEWGAYVLSLAAKDDTGGPLSRVSMVISIE